MTLVRSAIVGIMIILLQAPQGSEIERCGASINELASYKELILHDDDSKEVTVDHVGHNGRVTVLAWFDQATRTKYEAHPGYYYSDNSGASWYPVPDRRVRSADELIAQQVFNWGPHPAEPQLHFRHFNLDEPFAPTGRIILQRSSNGGITWNRVPVVPADPVRQLQSIEAHFYHPYMQGVLYIVGGTEPAGNVGFGLYLSEDRGDSFRLVLPREHDGTLLRLAFHPQRRELIYAIASRGLVVKSVDAGKTWRPMPCSESIRRPYLTKTMSNDEARARARLRDGWNIVRDIVIDPVVGETLYLVTSRGLLQTSDGGATWRVLPLHLGTADAINSVAIDPRNRDSLYAGTWLGLYRSSDRGCTWKRINLEARIESKK